MMAFFGFFNVYSLRVNLSVGIVAMTENRTIHYENGTIGYVSVCDKSISLGGFNQNKVSFYRNKNSHGIQKIEV